MTGESPLNMMRPPQQRYRKPAARRTGRRFWPIIVPLAFVIVLAAAWVWLWFYAASVANNTLAGWVEREAAAGRVYSCGSQSVGGFPLRVEAHCTDATAEIKSQQLPYAATAKGLSFVAEVWHPTRLVGDITGPLALAELGQPPTLIADWSRARLIVSGVPPDPDGLSIDLETSQLARVAGNQTLFKAKRANLQSHIVAGTPRDHPAIEVLLSLAGATAPIWHPLLADPVDTEFNAVLRGFKDLAPKPWAARFREMQAASGGIEIKSFRIARSNIIVVGKGTLNINEHGKLDGLVHVAIVGIEQIVPLLGVDRLIGQGIDRLAGTNGAAAQGASALDRLIPGLGGAIRQTANASLVENLKKMGQPADVENKPAVVLPLRFADGSIYLGMLRVGEVPALF